VNSMVTTLLVSALVVPISVFLIIRFIVRAFFIVAPSMAPTLIVGDRVLVSLLHYRLRPPRYGDIVVFSRTFGPDSPSLKRPRGAQHRRAVVRHDQHSRYSVKRVVAIGGQTVTIKPGSIFLGGMQLNEPYLRLDNDQAGEPSGFRSLYVRPGFVFVMGDDRARSKVSIHIPSVA
jgi:signal peptidase I